VSDITVEIFDASSSGALQPFRVLYDRPDPARLRGHHNIRGLAEDRTYRSGLRRPRALDSTQHFRETKWVQCEAS
jgi:hypothetical protein